MNRSCPGCVHSMDLSGHLLVLLIEVFLIIITVLFLQLLFKKIYQHVQTRLQQMSLGMKVLVFVLMLLFFFFVTHDFVNRVSDDTNVTLNHTRPGLT